MNEKKVAVVMGSDSDLKIVKEAIKTLKNFEINTEIFIMSAHKSPDITAEFAKNAKSRNFAVIIAAAGMAAHLAGVIASYTTLPVIGLPINCSLNGVDALISTVQMPPKVPVLTVGVNAAENAAIAACQILAIHNKNLENKLEKLKESVKNSIAEKNENLKLTDSLLL